MGLFKSNADLGSKLFAFSLSGQADDFFVADSKQGDVRKTLQAG
jgi:hypothetical protein